MLQLQNLLTEHADIPWQALTYLTGEVIYGGRVTDEWDHRCLRALLGRFFCEEVLTDTYSYSPDGVSFTHFSKNCNLTLSALSNYSGLFHSLFWIDLKRSVGLKGLKKTLSFSIYVLC